MGETTDGRCTDLVESFRTQITYMDHETLSRSFPLIRVATLYSCRPIKVTVSITWGKDAGPPTPHSSFKPTDRNQPIRILCTSMNNLASIFRAQGRTEEAAALEENVLEKRRQILGAKNPDTLTSTGNLAST